MLGFSEATSLAIRALDEHWDGQGQPFRLGEEIRFPVGAGKTAWRGRNGRRSRRGGFRLKPEDQLPATLFRLKAEATPADTERSGFDPGLRAQGLGWRVEDRGQGAMRSRPSFSLRSLRPDRLLCAHSTLANALRDQHPSECFSRRAPESVSHHQALWNSSTYMGVNVTV
jgi:hypothetical protein